MFFFTKLFLQIVRMNHFYIFAVSILFIGIGALAAYLIEPETFGNYFNALWWVMTTVTTVGYGDYYPHTVTGKCVGIILFIFGIGLISVTISKVVDALFVYQRKKEEGKLRYTGEGHFVIIDWSKNAEHAIIDILDTDPKVEIVLIDILEKTPFPHERVHYLLGNPVQLKTLEAANMSKARAVIIFSDEVTQHKSFIRDPSFIDGKTLLVATTIEKNYNHVYTIVEIKDKESLPNFQHIKIDEFIFGSEMISRLAVRSAFDPGTSKILMQLLMRQSGEDLYEIPKQPNWKTFHDAFLDLLPKGATLISDGMEMNINRRLDEAIPDRARLVVLCSKETYQTLSAPPGSSFMKR